MQHRGETKEMAKYFQRFLESVRLDSFFLSLFNGKVLLAITDAVLSMMVSSPELSF